MSTANMMIEAPNSSGQGYAPSHSEHLLHNEILYWGYAYSHSTPITALDGTQYLHHTYKRGEHNVGVHETGGRLVWDTSVSCGSGHRWTGIGLRELTAHLQSKARRYVALKRAK